MKECYSENGLKMNSNKTQSILFATPNFNKRTEMFQITIDDTVRQMEDEVKNLGVRLAATLPDCGFGFTIANSIKAPI